MLKKIIKKITGFDSIEEEIKELKQHAADELKGVQEELNMASSTLNEAKQKIKEAEEAARFAKLSDKDKATERGEPYVAVIDTHVNKDNIRNGFFELEWNRLFVDLLLANGYGAEGDSEETIVDQWFRAMCSDVANEMNIDMSNRGSGFINVIPLSKNQSEVS